MKNIILKIEDNGIDLKKTFECGQCFRFESSGENSFEGVLNGQYISVCQKDGYLFFEHTDCGCEDAIRSFFDMDTDYGIITATLIKTDEVMKRAAEFGKGIRILKQDLFETIISFIISQNNNIPRIKKIIDSLCKNFGKEIVAGDKTVFSFPSLTELKNVTVENLAVIRAGFRAKYIVDAVAKIASGEVSLERIKELSYEESKTELMKIKGIGPKVADCVLLFGAGKYGAFPKDVWVKRVMKTLYNDENAVIEGEFAGIGQQYLFYYARETKLGQETEGGNAS